MDNNDILIRLRYALDIKDADMVEVFRLGGLELTKEAVQKMLKNPKKDEATDTAGAAAPSEDDQLACDNATLGIVLERTHHFPTRQTASEAWRTGTKAGICAEQRERQQSVAEESQNRADFDKRRHA